MNFMQTSVTKALALALDRSDILYRIDERHRRVAGDQACRRDGDTRIEPRQESTAIVVQQVLRRFVRGATEGKAVQMDDKRRRASRTSPRRAENSSRMKIESLLEGLSTRMGERFLQRESLHLSSVGWQALGLIFHEMIIRLRGNLTCGGSAMPAWLAPPNHAFSDPSKAPSLKISVEQLAVGGKH